MRLYDKVEKLLKLIPSRHKLRPVIEDNLDSILYCPPEGETLWYREVSLNLTHFISYPPEKEWQWKVFELWTKKKRSEVGKAIVGTSEDM